MQRVGGVANDLEGAFCAFCRASEPMKAFAQALFFPIERCDYVVAYDVRHLSSPPIAQIGPMPMCRLAGTVSVLLHFMHRPERMAYSSPAADCPSPPSSYRMLSACSYFWIAGLSLNRFQTCTPPVSSRCAKPWKLFSLSGPFRYEMTCLPKKKFARPSSFFSFLEVSRRMVMCFSSAGRTIVYVPSGMLVNSLGSSTSTFMTRSS